MAKAFIILSLTYLLLGLTFGVIGSLQYVFPSLLTESLAFHKSRPLHVYLVISWLFTAAQGLLYYFIPRVAGRSLYWQQGTWIHFALQAGVSLSIITGFFMGYFGGREYLEFPPFYAFIIAISWLPLAINFFATIRPSLGIAPVYIWNWTIGIVFFFLTLAESYLWTLDFVMSNTVRDITIQWKALGSMVGSWNMLIYGCTLFLMEKLSGDKTIARNRTAFFFFFVGFVNLMFNWGHHTYAVPAAPWIATVSYVISMTELLIFGHIIYKWKQTLSNAMRNGKHLTHKLLFLADAWIFFNLALAIAISVPALNAYTHGTHITVAHAMGATIGINTMLIFASIVFIAKKDHANIFQKYSRTIRTGTLITNAALAIFWISLIGSGLVKISGQLNSESFAIIMKKSEMLFKWFAGSGIFIMIGLLLMIIPAIRVLSAKRPTPRAKRQELRIQHAEAIEKEMAE